MLSSHEDFGPHVLVVDDEVGVREVIREALEDEGFATLAARDGIEAMANIEAGRRPCLIVLDLMMPRMDGWEFAAWLAADDERRSIPFVVVTAHEPVPSKDGLGRAHAVLAKPLQLDELVAVVGEYCSTGSPTS